MHVQLRTVDEEIIGSGDLGMEYLGVLNAGDILKLGDDCFNTQGTFGFISKVVHARHGRKYCPEVVLYVRIIP